MDETICSERRISNEQLLPAESVHTVAVPLQSAVQSTYIINEMTTIEFSSNRTLQIHFMFSAAEDQMNVFQFKILISNELRGTITVTHTVLHRAQTLPPRQKYRVMKNICE